VNQPTEPSGGSLFLSSCIEKIRTGTAYTKLDRLALALSTDSKLSRLLQLADVVTACSTNVLVGRPPRALAAYMGAEPTSSL
jgi:hypothetical protein